MKRRRPALLVPIIISIISILSGCASEIAQRAPQEDPASAKAGEAGPSPRSSLSEPDPILDGAPAVKPPAARAAVYTCPMHSQVRAPAPGKCPICGMTLIPLEEKK